jgi:hypothetical protein
MNKNQQKFDYGRARSALNNRLGGWQRKHNRTQRSYDDRRNLDAAILGVHGKQNTTRRHSRSKKG